MTTALAALAAAVVVIAAASVLLRRPEWGLVLLCLSSPIGLIYIGAAQVITVVAIGVIGVMIGSRWGNGDPPFPPIAFSGAILFWTITVLLSVLFSPYYADAALFGLWLIVSGLLALSVPGIADTRERLKPVVVAWLVSAIVIVVAGSFIQPAAPTDPAQASAEYGGAVIEGRATSVFGQPNEYGLYCAMLLMVSLAVLIGGRGWIRWLGLVAAACTGLGLVQSYSRGAWIGAAVGVVVLVMVLPQARRPVAITVALGAFLFAGYAAVVPDDPTVTLVTSRVGSIVNPAENPDDDRLVIVAEGFRQFGQYPVFGVGPNAYMLEGATNRSLEEPVGAVHAHNMALTVAAEQGLVGVAALLVIAAVIVVRCIPVLPVVTRAQARRLGRVPGPPDWVAVVLAGTIAALSASMISGLVDAPLRNALMRTTLWFTIGMAVACAEILRRQFRVAADRTAAPTVPATAPEHNATAVS